jgi:SAM-dependent methyltransferase
MVLDLGVQPLANNLLLTADLHREPKFPLRLAVCQDCWLMQIVDLVPPVQLFTEYLYFSSFSESMLNHARQAAERYAREYGFGQQSLVLEIASNDGYLLQNFVRLGIPCLGIEPAANIAKVAQTKGIESLVDFFGQELARRLAGYRRKADLILGNNVLAHAPNTNDFVGGLPLCLKPGGRIVLEFPYGVDFVEKCEFDTVYHEHVFYFTLTALQPLFKRHGLAIFHVEQLPIHGGSLRLFAAREGDYPIQDSVRQLAAEEQQKGVNSLAYYQKFAARVAQVKEDLLKLLNQLKQDGHSIAAYGASAKGSTLLNYCGITNQQINFITDRSTYKHDRLSPGAHIPIGPPQWLVERQPDYTLLLTWNFAEEILQQQQAYRDKGGKFILPIPRVTVV